MSWHADGPDLDRYASGSIDHVRASSIEAHLLACASCRGRVAAVVEHDRLSRAWGDVVDRLDRPRPVAVERLLRRVGVSKPTARLLAVTPSLRLSWLLAVAVALAFSVVAAGSAGGDVVVFLVVAPLLPLAGVAASFGPGVDPAYEVTTAAPTSGVRLLFIRAASVFSATFAMALVAALALPGPAWAAAAWILPALALSLATLGLATVTTPDRAAVAVAAAWIAAVLLGARAADDWLALFRGGAQGTFVAVIALAVAVIVQRRDVFDIRARV